MTLVQLTELFRLMTLINVGILIVTVILCLLLKNLIYRLHGALFNLTEPQIAAVLYNFLGQFKLLVVIFNLVPYIALVLMQ